MIEPLGCFKRPDLFPVILLILIIGVGFQFANTRAPALGRYLTAIVFTVAVGGATITKILCLW